MKKLTHVQQILASLAAPIKKAFPPGPGFQMEIFLYTRLNKITSYLREACSSSRRWKIYRWTFVFETVANTKEGL